MVCVVGLLVAVSLKFTGHKLCECQTDTNQANTQEREREVDMERSQRNKHVTEKERGQKKTIT